MVIQLVSFDGFDLDNDDFTAGFPYEGQAFDRHATPITLPTIGGFARSEGFEHEPAEFQVETLILGDIVAGKNTLLAAFRVGRSGALVIDEDGVEKQRTCRVIDAFPLAGSSPRFMAVLEAADPRWRATEETEVVETVTADGQTWDVENDGNATVDDAVIVFQPQQQKAASDAQLYRRFANIANRVGEPYPDPIEITNGGINHASLVSGGKSKTAGEDLRVLRNGIEIPRYLGEHADNEANSAATKVWVTPGYGATASAELRDAITNIAPADGGDLVVKRGGTRGWPASGALVIEDTDEVIRYDGLADPDVDGYDGFKSITRGQWGTSAASASAGDVVYRVQHKVELLYGHTGATAPESRPELKPMFDLTSNTLDNERWEWLKLYDDVYPSRAGQWSRVQQARDSQAGYMFLPTGQPTGATWRYNYGPAEPDELPYNVITRRFPSGTSGGAGQVGFDYDIDATLQLRVIGTDAEGVEVQADIIHGEDADTYASTLTNVLRAVSLYARSQVVLSTPDFADRVLSNLDGPESQVAAVNTADDASIYVANELDEPVDVRGVMALLYFSGTPRADVTLAVAADDGDGAITTNYLGLVGLNTEIATSANSAVWVGGVLEDLLGNGSWDTVLPALIMPGAAVHVYVGTASVSHAALFWHYQYAVQAGGAWPWYAYRLLGDGAIHPDARAELGETAGVTAVGVDLDADGVPYFSLGAEASVYQADHVLKNNTTGQELRFNLYIGTSDEIEIDCGRRSVRNLTTGETGLIYGVTLDPTQAGFFALAPGTNELQLDDAGVVEVDFTVTFRAAWE
ncbi:MAG: hypothetical protein AB7I38_10940 [Dehalococcoidia bacterium]